MITCGFCWIKWKWTAKTRHTSFILSDFTRQALSEVYRKVKLWSDRLFHITWTRLFWWLLLYCWRSKFHYWLIIWLSLEIDICEFVCSIFCLNFSIAWHWEENIISEHQTFWIWINIKSLIILVKQSDLYRGVKIFSTHKFFRPSSFINYFKSWRIWPIIRPINCIILCKIIVQ